MRCGSAPSERRLLDGIRTRCISRGKGIKRCSSQMRADVAGYWEKIFSKNQKSFLHDCIPEGIFFKFLLQDLINLYTLFTYLCFHSILTLPEGYYKAFLEIAIIICIIFILDLENYWEKNLEITSSVLDGPISRPWWRQSSPTVTLY